MSIVNNVPCNRIHEHVASVVSTVVVYLAGRSRFIRYSPNSTVFGLLLSSGLGIGCMLCEPLRPGGEGGVGGRKQFLYAIANFFIGNALIFPLVSYVLYLNPVSILGIICFNLVSVVIHASIYLFSRNTESPASVDVNVDRLPLQGNVVPVAAASNSQRMQRQRSSCSDSPTWTALCNCALIALYSCAFQNISTVRLLAMSGNVFSQRMEKIREKRGWPSFFLSWTSSFLSRTRLLMEGYLGEVMYGGWCVWDKLVAYNHDGEVKCLHVVLRGTQQVAFLTAHGDPSVMSQFFFYLAQNANRGLSEIRFLLSIRKILYRGNERAQNTRMKINAGTQLLCSMLPPESRLQSNCSALATQVNQQIDALCARPQGILSKLQAQEKESIRHVARQIMEGGIALAKFCVPRATVSVVKCKLTNFFVYCAIACYSSFFEEEETMSASQWGAFAENVMWLHICLSTIGAAGFLGYGAMRLQLPALQEAAQSGRSILKSPSWLQTVCKFFPDPVQYQAHPPPVILEKAKRGIASMRKCWCCVRHGGYWAPRRRR